MTLSSILTDALSVVSQFSLYIGIAVAIPLGLRFANWIRKAVAH